MGQLFFANLVGSIRLSYIRGPKSFAQHVLGTFALFDDHCLWLAESRALLWMKKKIKIKMNDGVARFFTRFGGNLFICWLVGGAALSRRRRLFLLVEVPCEGWWKYIDLTWLDFSLHFRSCCPLRVCCKFGPKLASHYKPFENEVKSGLSEPCSAN